MQSRFIRLTEYCLVEYQFSDLGSSDLLIEEPYQQVITPEGEIYIYNLEQTQTETGNIRDYSVIAVNSEGGRLVYLDAEKVPNYVDYNTNLIKSAIDYSGTLVGDKVRYHIAAGFQFTEFSSLALSINQAMNNGNVLILSSLLVNTSTLMSIVKFNTRPLIIGNTMYDRYIDVIIPSIKNIDEEYYTAVDKTQTFSYKATAGVGLVKNNPITVSLFECKSGLPIKTQFEEYDTFDINQGFTTTITQANEFSLVGAEIKEADDGDYIQFYATYASGFPEEFISVLRKRSGQSWIIFHQLNVYEQIGSNFIKSGEVSFYQDSNFDLPLKYRPILDRANEAVNLTIDYSIRLVNSVTNEQIIRFASLIIPNPNKYGRSLLKLKLASEPESNKISNLIIKKETDSLRIFTDPAIPKSPNAIATEFAQIKASSTPTIIPEISIRTVTEYVPVFYTSDNILLTDVTKLIKDKKSTNTAFGQGKLPIVVNQFDNTFKFKVLQIKPETDTSFPFNLSTFSSFELVFGSGNSRITVKNTKEQSQVDASVGEILFKVDSDTSVKILDLTDSKFYIVSVSSDGSRSALYTGTWYKADDINSAEVQKKSEAEKAKAELDLQEQLKTLQSQIDALRLENDQLKKNATSVQATLAAPAGALNQVPPTKTPVTNTAPPRETNYQGGVKSSNTTAPSTTTTGGSGGSSGTRTTGGGGGGGRGGRASRDYIEVDDNRPDMV
jgi:hypothetical protein